MEFIRRLITTPKTNASRQPMLVNSEAFIIRIGQFNILKAEVLIEQLEKRTNTSQSLA